MSNLQQCAFKNQLLRALSEDDFGHLAPHLVQVSLAKSDPLVEPDKPIQHSWFVEDGVASVVLSTLQGNETEVGIIGREGMADLATVHGIDRSPFRCFVQVPGSAYRMPALALRQALDASPAMRHIMAQYAYRFMVQVSGTASANASFTIEQRLARWLLMCHDRADNDHVALTHEFLALMLNVRRAGVTTALQTLERAELINGTRGLIAIKNRRKLEAFAGDSYSVSERISRGD